MTDLSIQLGGLKLKNPVVVASGTFGYGRETEGLVDLDALGAIVTKSVSLETRDGNPPERIVELPAGMLNSIGLANVGVEKFVQEKLPFLRSLQTSIIVNVAGRTIEEFEAVVYRLEQEDGIAGYELNFSCPNVKEGGLEFSQDAAVTERATAQLRKATGRPLIVKLTPNITRISDTARAAAQGGADAVSLINTLVGMAVDIRTGRPKIYTGTGGYSGPAIKPIALAKVFEVYSQVKIPIMGIGGIASLEDALEFILTGASAIQVGTANFIDPRTSEKIVEGLPGYCAEHNYNSISEMVGALDSPPWKG